MKKIKMKLKINKIFINYSKQKKIIIKRKNTKYEESTNKRVFLEFLRDWHENLRGKREKKGEDMVVVGKPPWILEHTPPHRVKRVEIFQTPP